MDIFVLKILSEAELRVEERCVLYISEIIFWSYSISKLSFL